MPLNKIKDWKKIESMKAKKMKKKKRKKLFPLEYLGEKENPISFLGDSRLISNQHSDVSIWPSQRLS